MKTLATLLCLMIGLPQANAPAGQPQQMIAVVRNSAGELVRHLRANDFVLEEDGVPQPISQFEEDSNVPVSLGILIDISGSMNTRSGGMSRLSAAQGTVRMLLRMMKPGDQFILMSFETGFSVNQDFTEDPRAIESALNKLTPMGNTNLFSAVGSALQKMKKAKHRTRALVLITDGLAGGDLQSLARNIVDSETLIYTFGLGDRQTANIPQAAGGFGAFGGGFGGFGNRGTPQVMSTPQQILDTLAQDSGGNSEIFDVADLDTAIMQMVNFDESIVADMRGQYTMSYVSQLPSGPAGHAVRLRTVANNLRVRARRNAASLTKSK